MSSPSGAPCRALVVAICGVLTIAGATGCTQRQSQDQYAESLQQAIIVREEVRAGIGRDQYDTAPKLRQARRRVDEAIVELDAAAPPEEVEPAHERMLEGMEALSVLLSRLAGCVQAREAVDFPVRSCRRGLSQQVFDEVRNDFREADTIYGAEGYEVPGEPGQERGV